MSSVATLTPCIGRARLSNRLLATWAGRWFDCAKDWRGTGRTPHTRIVHPDGARPARAVRRPPAELRALLAGLRQAGGNRTALPGRPAALLHRLQQPHLVGRANRAATLVRGPPLARRQPLPLLHWRSRRGRQRHRGARAPDGAQLAAAGAGPRRQPGLPPAARLQLDARTHQHRGPRADGPGVVPDGPPRHLGRRRWSGSRPGFQARQPTSCGIRDGRSDGRRRRSGGWPGPLARAPLARAPLARPSPPSPALRHPPLAEGASAG